MRRGGGGAGFSRDDDEVSGDSEPSAFGESGGTVIAAGDGSLGPPCPSLLLCEMELVAPSAPCNDE